MNAVLAWTSLLALLAVINWIWTGDAIQVACFGAAIFAALTVTLAVHARRRSPVETLPLLSSGAVMAAAGLGLLVFGLSFGEFPIIAGAVLLIGGLAHVAIERRH
ncbi:MAG: hypothetical protein J2O48_06475 [Solirubrobacterales bacterium]|nr:hypothetical protein [Solirubrobacterales bacterium]